ncbi:MAG: Gfo/Idh/MocA family protein [Flavobacteriales bacterium]
MSTPLKIGVIGSGSLALEAMRFVQRSTEHFSLEGFYSTSEGDLRSFMNEFGMMPFHHAESLIECVDAVVIACEGSSVYEFSRLALRSLKHVFVFGPPTLQSDQARELLKVIREARLIGHVYNPLFLSEEWQFCATRKVQPEFMEYRRVMPSIQGVTHPMLLHAIDAMHLVLSATDANARRVSANGIIRAGTASLCNARIELDNGAVADIALTSSGQENKQIIDVHFSSGSMSIDLIQHRITEEILDSNAQWKVRDWDFSSQNLIGSAMMEWKHDIELKPHLGVTWHQATRALELALQVIEKLNSHVLLQDPDVYLEP